MNYSIGTGDSDLICAGISEHEIEAVAKRHANRLREPVYYYSDSDGEDVPCVCVEPDLTDDEIRAVKRAAIDAISACIAQGADPSESYGELPTYSFDGAECSRTNAAEALYYDTWEIEWEAARKRLDEPFQEVLDAVSVRCADGDIIAKYSDIFVIVSQAIDGSIPSGADLFIEWNGRLETARRIWSENKQRANQLWTHATNDTLTF